MKKTLCDINTITELVQHIFIEIMQTKRKSIRRYITLIIRNKYLAIDNAGH